MSAEKIIQSNENLSDLRTPLAKRINIPGRVDINDLLTRARKKKEKEDKISLVFFGLIASLILIVGILLSL